MKLYRNLYSAVLLPCLLLVLSGAGFANPLIKGIVINGSNNQNVAGIQVQLRRSGDPGKPGKLIATTTSGSNGQFVFSVPASEQGSLLVATANYQGFPYEVPAYDGGQHLAQFNVKIDPAKVRLPIFETSHSLIPLQMRVSHLNVKTRPGGLSCVEFLIVDNPSKKTFLGIGDDKATILLDLPKGAKNVRLDSQTVGATLNKRPDGYSISLPIPPTLNTEGTALIVDYDIDWPSRLPWKRSVDLTTEVQYPTKFFFVQRAAEDGALQVTGARLSGDSSVKMNIDGKPIDSLINAVGNPQGTEIALKPGDPLQITVSSPINPTFWAFLGFLILLIILIPLSLWRRSAKPSPNEVKADKMGEPVNEQSVYGKTLNTGAASTDWIKTPAAAALIEQIAALDETYAAGNIDQDEYYSQRDACKRALLQLAPEIK